MVNFLPKQLRRFQQDETLVTLLTAERVPRTGQFRYIRVRQRGNEAFVNQLVRRSPQDEKIRKQNRRLNRRLVVVTVATLVYNIGRIYAPPLAAIAIFLIIYNVRDRIKQGINSLRNGKLDVNVLASLSVIMGIVSGFVSFSGFVAIIAISTRKLGLQVQGQAMSEVIDVFKQQPQFVRIVIDGEEEIVPFDTLEKGDIVVVRAGDMIPVDGLVCEGAALVDQHILTGESQPVERDTGSEVYASTVVLSGIIYVQVQRAGDKTSVAQIGKLLNKTISHRSEMQLRADEITNKTVMPTIVLSAAMMPFFGLAGSTAILMGHFKYKGSMMASVGMINYFRIFAENSILLKDGRALDNIAQVDTIVFDKTGTLTINQPHVGAIYTIDGISEQQVLRYAATAEQHQAHPIAHAILNAADEYAIDIPMLDDVEYELGYGLKIMLDEQVIHVGSQRFMLKSERTIPDHILDQQEHSHANGFSLVMVAVDGEVVGAIELVPTIRPEVETVIQQIQAYGEKTTYIISGDHEAPTRRLAEQLGIDHYFAETLPEQKADIIQQLRDEGRIVCYIGDGINDSIALSKAHVSVSLLGASTVATDTAQVILMDKTLKSLPLLFDYGEKYSKNARNTLGIVIGASAVGMVTAFLPFPMVGVLSWNTISLLGGFSNAMIPLARHKMNLMQPDQNMVELPSTTPAIEEA